MRAVLLAALVGAAGCNQLFGLDEPGGGDGGGSLDAARDARDDDAGPCTGGGHDEDSDGVGDACDPSNRATHRLAAFYSFTALTGLPGPDYLVHLRAPTARRQRLVTQLRVTSEDLSSTATRTIGLWVRATRGTDASYPIGLVFELGADTDRRFYRFGTSATSVPEPVTTSAGDVLFDWQVGRTYVLTVDLDSEGATTGSLAGGDGVRSTTYSGGDPLGGIVGLRLRGLAAELDYFAIIEEGSR